jgi:hypothetical protein
MNLNALEIIENMLSMKEVVVKRTEELNHLLSELDCKLVDLDHVMEFYDFNASQNSTLVTLRKNVLRERREVKDEMDMLKPFRSKEMLLQRGHGAHKHIKTIMKKIENEQNQRTYKVRIMNELFGDTLNKETKPEL